MSQDLVESFSGIRGIYGRGITEELAQRYCFCYCKLFEPTPSLLVVGGDTRPSTPSLKAAMIEAFKTAGVGKIIDVGVVPIQLAEYAILKFKADGGIYVSASHNEPEYNGWKCLKEDGAILYASQTDKLIQAVHSFSNRNPTTIKLEIIEKQDEVVEAYLDYISEKIGEKALQKIKNSRFKVLADPNGGAGITVLSKLFKRLGVAAKILNNQLGRFERLVEPKAESLRPLAEEMKSGEYDFACGFDCDSDRVEFVISSDSEFAQRVNTPVVSGHYVLSLCCDALLRGTERQVVVVNDATSYLVRDIAKRQGARIQEVEVGETNVVQEMEKQNSIIGGEGSCSGVIMPPIKCRDGIMSVVLVLKLLAEGNKSLTEILKDYPAYYSDRTKVYCPPERAAAIKRKIEDYFKAQGYEIKKTGDETGGLKVLVDENSFVWFRQSKTEPGVLRVHTEGDGSKEKVTQILNQGIEAFNKFKA